MPEPNHITVLEKCLEQCEEAIPLIHDKHDRQIEVDHAELLRTEIRRMEDWRAKQAKIKAGTPNGQI